VTAVESDLIRPCRRSRVHARKVILGTLVIGTVHAEAGDTVTESLKAHPCVFE